MALSTTLLSGLFAETKKRESALETARMTFDKFDNEYRFQEQCVHYWTLEDRTQRSQTERGRSPTLSACVIVGDVPLTLMTRTSR